MGGGKPRMDDTAMLNRKGAKDSLASQTVQSAISAGRYDREKAFSPLGDGSMIDPELAIAQSKLNHGATLIHEFKGNSLASSSPEVDVGSPTITVNKDGTRVQHTYLYSPVLYNTGSDDYGVNKIFNVPIGASSSICAPFRHIISSFSAIKFNKVSFSYRPTISKTASGSFAFFRSPNVFSPSDPDSIPDASLIEGTRECDIKGRKDGDSLEYDIGGSGVLSTVPPANMDQMPFCHAGYVGCLTQGVLNSSGTVYANGTTLGYIFLTLDFTLSAMNLADSKLPNSDMVIAVADLSNSTVAGLTAANINAFCTYGFSFLAAPVTDALNVTGFNAERFIISKTGFMHPSSSTQYVRCGLPANSGVRVEGYLAVTGTGLVRAALPAAFQSGWATAPSSVSLKGRTPVVPSAFLGTAFATNAGTDSSTFQAISFTGDVYVTQTAQFSALVGLAGTSFLTSSTTITSAYWVWNVTYKNAAPAAIDMTSIVLAREPSIAYVPKHPWSDVPRASVTSCQDQVPVNLPILPPPPAETQLTAEVRHRKSRFVIGEDDDYELSELGTPPEPLSASSILAFEKLEKLLTKAKK